jgi:predicted RNase H-like nuclease
VAGVDATRGVWVAVELEAGGFLRDLLLPFDLEDALPEAQVIAVDIPIGFGPRSADGAARHYLRGASSTVFTTPPRRVLERPFGPGLGVSAQAHALGARILHVTNLSATDSRLREAHPEVSFRAMNGGAPLGYRKKAAGGALERLRLLAAQGIELGRLESAATAPLDDVLDAAACAWTAARIAAGRARSLPDPPELVNGRQTAIWY